MVNRVLKVLIEFNAKECSLNSKRAIYDFALVESNFLVNELDEYFTVEYINDKYVKLTLYGDEIKVLVNFPYVYKSNSCPHLITLLYSDSEACDEMILPGYLLEINEHRIYEDSYSKFVPRVDKLARFDPPYEGGLTIRRMYIIYPLAKSILRYINDCEMEFIHFDTDINGANIVTYLELKDDKIEF